MFRAQFSSRVARSVSISKSSSKLVSFSAVLLALVSLAGCSFSKSEFGSAGNPVKLFFVPSVDAKVVDSNSKIMKQILEANTPYKFEVQVPQSYIAVVEAFGSKKADVSALNTFGYLLANQKYGAEARLTVVRFGSTTYQSQIIAKKGKFKDIKDLVGKKFAFVDAASTSGYILPLKLLQDAGIKLGETTFAMKHDNVVSMVYNGQVDAGATFYTPKDEKDGIQDARRLVKVQYPDVEEKIEILKLTDGIPNDPIVFRKDMPEEMKTKITEAFLTMIKSEEGRTAFKNLYGVTDLKTATDKDYDGVRATLASLNKKADDFMKK
jgi:phosphonate transport system substrate-binding protein